MNNEILFLLIIFILFFILLIVIFLLFNLFKKNYSNELNNAINDIKLSLNSDFNSFNKHLYSEFNDLSDRTNDRLNSLEDKISNNLNRGYKENNDIFNNINEKIIKIDEAQKGIKELSLEVVSLKTLLTDKKARGTFGEIELYSLLENIYGDDNRFFQKQYKLNNGCIADAVIFNGDNTGIICIDSKFPLENYRKLNDPIYDQEEVSKLFKNDIKKHIYDIKKKYIIEGVTAPLAYMFIPAEAIFSEIYANYLDLVDLSYKENVYIVSPTTLMAYITAIKSIYLGHLKDEKAKEIGILLNELAKDFNIYDERFNKLYKDFNNLNNDFENIFKVTNKISKKFQRINGGDLDGE